MFIFSISMPKPINETDSFVYIMEEFVDQKDLDIDSDGLTLQEEIHYGLLPWDPDFDNDTLLDGFEIANNLSPLLADTDGDSLPDNYEMSAGLNATLFDSGEDYDNDGLTNLQEYMAHTNPLEFDTDGDGFSDGKELADGTNPLKQWSNLRNRRILIGSIIGTIGIGSLTFSKISYKKTDGKKGWIPFKNLMKKQKGI